MYIAIYCNNSVETVKQARYIISHNIPNSPKLDNTTLYVQGLEMITFIIVKYPPMCRG